jgi:transglutaminase-like putative cysteine protease
MGNQLWALMGMLLCTIDIAGAQQFGVISIPEPLRKDAAVVVRQETQDYEVEGIKKGRLSYKLILTVMNKAGDRHAEMAILYDRFSPVSDIKASLYDATGQLVRQYKKADIKDQSLVSNYSIYEDTRVKHLQFLSTTYPYTIEYSYVQEFDGFLTLPSWRPISSFEMAVEQSTFTLRCDASYAFKQMQGNMTVTDSTVVNGKRVFSWSCAQLPAFAHEPLSAGLDDLVPWVTLSPNAFEYDKSTGKMGDWKEFGTWAYSLSKGTDVLSVADKTHVHALIKNAATDREKIIRLYKYMQENTRYVSVQLGIGGFRPIAAEKVAQVGYGDCKGLSNYMRGMLQEAGIKSYLVMIASGRPGLNPQYASVGQANHMILCIPTASDTLFLECTSQHYPMGYIGSNNAGRPVLLVTDAGGELAMTPEYTAEDNFQRRRIRVQLDEPGKAKVHIETDYGYAQFEGALGKMLTEPVEQRKRITEDLEIPGMSLGEYRYLQADKQEAMISEEINLTSGQLISKGGNKLFLTLNLLSRREHIPTSTPNRKTGFKLAFQYTDEDEVVYELPPAYQVEHLPTDIVITSDFGTYAATFIRSKNTITYHRKQQMNGKRFPPERYGDYVEFCKQVYQADKQKAVLTNIQ